MNEAYRTKAGTLYEIDDEFSYVQTIFPDGTANTGVPQFDEASERMAREIGYDGDREEVVWAMTRHHDLLHSLVSECAFDFKQFSPSLRYHIDGPPPKGIVPMEERVVFMVQKLVVRLMRAGVDEADVMALLGATKLSEYPR